KPNTAYRQYKKSLGIYQKSDARIDSRPKRTARRRIVNGCKLRQNHQGIGRKRNQRGRQVKRGEERKQQGRRSVFARPPLALRQAVGDATASNNIRRIQQP